VITVTFSWKFCCKYCTCIAHWMARWIFLTYTVNWLAKSIFYTL